MKLNVTLKPWWSRFRTTDSSLKQHTQLERLKKNPHQTNKQTNNKETNKHSTVQL